MIGRIVWRHKLTIIPDHEAQDAALFASWKIDALKCKCTITIHDGTLADNQQTTTASPTPQLAIQMSTTHQALRPVHDMQI
jgi:hypothetical protein